MSVAAVFERHGEDRFREWEAEIALELAMERNLVVATGGGTLMNNRVFKELNVYGFTAYLRWPFEKLYQRISLNGEHRPLVESYGKEGLRKLLAEREPRYCQAHLEVYANGYSPISIAKVIYHAFKS
jgi:shikimate kinase